MTLNLVPKEDPKLLDDEVLAKLENAPVCYGAPFTGLVVVEHKGLFIAASPDLIRAWVNHQKAIKAAAVVYKSREQATEDEIKIMGQNHIRIGARVIVAGSNRSGEIVRINTGAFNRPYYKILLDVPDGQTRDEINDEAHAYARQLFFDARDLVPDQEPALDTAAIS